MSDQSTKQLSNEIIQAALSETIEKCLKTSKYETIVEAGSKKGDNFMGVVYRVTCRQSGINTNSSDLKLILKTAPQSEQMREAFFTRPCFEREIYLFDEVFPFFRQFEQSKGIIKDSFNEYPICHKTIDIAPYECLILQDLRVDNFVMVDHRTEDLTAEHVNLVMAALGKFHAISFAIKDQQPTKLQDLTRDMSEIFFRLHDPHLDAYVNAFKDQVNNVANSLNNIEIAEKVGKLFSGNVFHSMYECVRGDLAEPYAVICHGDCWNNNTMFQLDVNRSPVGVRLLDFQISRYASPVLDILYYIFCCTQKKLRDQHYDCFLKVYHASLSKHLERLGCDVDKLFPYSAMLGQLKQFGKFSLFMGVMIIPMLTTDASDIPELDQFGIDYLGGSDLTSLFKSDEGELNKRLGDIMVDMHRLDYF